MKKLFIAIVTSLLFIQAAVAQEEAEKKPIGLNFALDYYSDYHWRGTRFYNRDGAIVPSITWSIFDTGLTIGLLSEVSQSFIWEGFQKKPNKYYLQMNPDDLTVYWTKKNLKFNHIAYAFHSLDPGIDYTYKVKDIITINANIWYWWFYNSGRATELARKKVVGLNQWKFVDYSFLLTTVGITLDFIPYLQPKISVTNDYYTMMKRGGDFYIQFSTGHEFVLTKEVKLVLGSSVAYYYNRTNKVTNYYLYFDGANFYPRMSRTPIRKGVSDMAESITLLFTKDIVTFKAGFTWLIVPAKSFYKGDVPHRYFANLGISCLI
ncbi:MAG TPA: hypothetical protein P5136_00945 [Methanofastidiosum sp.]|nr:hypothetical protein [Methanofastidiosum sp.]